MRGRALRGPFPKIRMVAEKGSVKMPLASRIRYCTAAPAEIGIEPIAACAALVILRGLEVQEGAALLRRSTTDHTCICHLLASQVPPSEQSKLLVHEPPP